jgi:hypothetical protein
LVVRQYGIGEIILLRRGQTLLAIGHMLSFGFVSKLTARSRLF